MLVTHLIIIGAKTTEEAAIHVLSILCLPQAIDCGGGLVNVLRSWLPCGLICLSLTLWSNLNGVFCYKTTGTWVSWNSMSGIISIPLRHRKEDY